MLSDPSWSAMPANMQNDSKYGLPRSSNTMSNGLLDFLDPARPAATVNVFMGMEISIPMRLGIRGPSTVISRIE